MGSPRQGDLDRRERGTVPGKLHRHTSGHMIVVMMDAGTTIPPIPRPASARSPHKT